MLTSDDPHSGEDRAGLSSLSGGVWQVVGQLTGTKLKGVRRGGLERRSPRVTEWGQLQRTELGSRSGRDTGSGSLQVDLGAPHPPPPQSAGRLWPWTGCVNLVVKSRHTCGSTFAHLYNSRATVPAPRLS